LFRGEPIVGFAETAGEGVELLDVDVGSAKKQQLPLQERPMQVRSNLFVEGAAEVDSVDFGPDGGSQRTDAEQLVRANHEVLGDPPHRPRPQGWEQVGEATWSLNDCHAHLRGVIDAAGMSPTSNVAERDGVSGRQIRVSGAQALPRRPSSRLDFSGQDCFT
jgi:hypothetical protein